MKRAVSLSKLRFARNLPSRPSCVKSVVYFAVAADFDTTTFGGSPRSAFTANAFVNANDARTAIAAIRLVVAKLKIKIFIMFAPTVGAEKFRHTPPSFLIQGACQKAK